MEYDCIDSHRTARTHTLLFSLLSSLLWWFCGYLLGDPWVWVPNFAGVIFGFLQIGVILHVTYPSLLADMSRPIAAISDDLQRILTHKSKNSVSQKFD